MPKDHRHEEQGAGPTAPGGESLPPLDSTKRVALERLLDQLDPFAAPRGDDRRVAGRLAGRWLMLRRLSRGLNRTMVAARTQIAEQSLELLELGLLDWAAVPDEAMVRLCLVLEAPQNDYERVSKVMRLAAGLPEELDLAFLRALEDELAKAALEESAAASPLPASQPQAFAPEVLAILEALRSAGSAAMTSYSILEWLREHRSISLSAAVLPRKLSALVRDGFVQRGPERLPVYTITPEGVDMLTIEQERAEKREAARLLDREVAAIALKKPSLFGV